MALFGHQARYRLVGRPDRSSGRRRLRPLPYGPLMAVSTPWHKRHRPLRFIARKTTSVYPSRDSVGAPKTAWRNVSLILVCQPDPPARKCAIRSASSRIVVCSLVGAFWRPRPLRSFRRPRASPGMPAAFGRNPLPSVPACPDLRRFPLELRLLHRVPPRNLRTGTPSCHPLPRNLT